MLVGVTVWIIGGFAMLQNVLVNEKVFGFSLILNMLIFEVLIYSAAHVFGNFPAIDLACIVTIFSASSTDDDCFKFLLPVWFSRDLSLLLNYRWKVH